MIKTTEDVEQMRVVAPAEGDVPAINGKSVYIQTYGCQMNVYDSERMADVLAPLGYRPAASADGADLVVLNTCHIRERATEKVYSEIGRIRRLKEIKAASGGQMKLVIAGCVAQAEGEEIMRRAPEVDFVVGPQAYHKLPELIAKTARATGERLETSFDAIEKFDALPVMREVDGPSAFVSVQEGCDKFCSFCVVPYTRGGEYSRDVDAILAEVRNLAAQGVREVTLLGQNVNAWHGNAPRLDGGGVWGLGRLVEEVAKVGGISRIRYSTSHPQDMDDALIAAHGRIEALMPLVHLPVQSGSDRILKAMNRKHGRDHYFEIVEKLKQARPDIAMTSDFIVGFPGESDRDFEDTMDLIRQVGFAMSYSFKYSRRPGTPAAEMFGQVPEHVQNERLQALQALLIDQQKAFNASKAGQTIPVLFTGKGRNPGQIAGRSPWSQAVHCDGPEHLIGQIADMKVTSGSQNSLTGELVAIRMATETAFA